MPTSSRQQTEDRRWRLQPRTYFLIVAAPLVKRATACLLQLPIRPLVSASCLFARRDRTTAVALHRNTSPRGCELPHETHWSVKILRSPLAAVRPLGRGSTHAAPCSTGRSRQEAAGWVRWHHRGTTAQDAGL